MKTMQQNRTPHCALLAALLAGFGVLNASAQFTFNSGSDGSYGPLNITTNTTLPLPPDGIFRCSTIFVTTNATLKFTPNALNTPVYLLATNDVIINGTIDVSGAVGTSLLGGAGGPGGFAGGNPGISGLAPGDGYGPGAGSAGNYTTPNGVGSAGHGTGGSNYHGTTNNGETYGSPLLMPLVGGSGGGGTIGGPSGAGGGGAILIACNTRIEIQGNILATSPDRFSSTPGLSIANYGYGSGGAIRLAASVVAGSGILNVNGGFNTAGQVRPCGGSGRIRIDCMDRRSMLLNCTPGVTTIGANMVAIPTNAPHLDITQVGTNNIPVGTGAPVFFMLPESASTNQTVQVQASNFGRVVPIRVVLTPDNGPSSSYDASIDNTGSPASVTVPVVVPVNVQVHVNAWTR